MLFFQTRYVVVYELVFHRLLCLLCSETGARSSRLCGGIKVGRYVGEEGMVCLVCIGLVDQARPSLALSDRQVLTILYMLPY